MAALSSTEPLYIVHNQLKTFIAVGTATANVMTEKIIFISFDCPLVNI